jgi:signal peptidase I
LFKILRITGLSLSPAYQHGDYVLIQKIRRISRLRTGDVIVFHQPGYGRLIKQVHNIDPEKETCQVTGTTPDSIGSETFGEVRLTAILGKVIFQIPAR